MTDLLEHTDCVFKEGVLSTISLDMAFQDTRLKVAEIHTPTPHLSWQLSTSHPNTIQQAYEIQLATSREKLLADAPDLWDSGRVESSQNLAVPYDGKALQSGQCYWWRVRVWDNYGQVSPYSEPKAFRTASTFSDTIARYPLQKSYEAPIGITHENNVYFIDFGQATFGQVTLSLFATGSQDTVTLHLGEAQKDGRVDRHPGGSIRYTSYRIPLRQGQHTYTLQIIPDKRNTDPNANESGVHPILMPSYIGEVYPFRYCELEHYNGLLRKNDIVRHSVHYPFDPGASWFSCNDSVLNRVWQLCKHTIKATSFCGVYVDGDRERIPYEADAYINQLSHYSVDQEFSMARYTIDHLIKWPTWPTEWLMQSVLMAWNDYLYTGDTLLISRHYDMLRQRTLSALRDSTGLVTSKMQTPAILRQLGFHGKAIRDIVDWPQSGAAGIEKTEEGEADGFVLSRYNAVVNAYHYRTLRMMEQIATVLGHTQDATTYTQDADRFFTLFNQHFFNPQTGCYSDAPGSNHQSLHANMFALAFRLVPAEHLSTVCNHIQSRGMACSVYGAQFLMDALFEAGVDEYAMSLLNATGKRSWYNMIRLGSSVCLEAWDPVFKPNLDWNHAWGAAPANLIPRYVMGLEPLEGGFRKLRIKPHPGTLEFASAIIPTIQGDVRITYDNSQCNRFEIHVVTPPNTTTEIWLPRYGKTHTLLIDGTHTRAEIQGSYLVTVLGSGAHNLISEE